MTSRISFNKYWAEHLRDIVKNKDYDTKCVECRTIIKRLNKFVKGK